MALRSIFLLVVPIILLCMAYYYLVQFRFPNSRPPPIFLEVDSDTLTYLKNVSIPPSVLTKDTTTPPGPGTSSATVPTSSAPKTILLWGKWFGRPWPFPPNITCFAGHYVCRYVTDRTRYSSSDAILYHGRDVGQTQDIAPLDNRPKNQVWIYYNMESPQQTFVYPKVPSVFNWTATYVSTSDFAATYGRMTAGVKYNGGFDPSKNYLEGKTGTATAIISNCYAASAGERLKFINALSKFIDIDVYGGCGKGKCDDCREKIQYYKFYLSFENAYCLDYITEKFYYNGLSFGAVPVVISGANLSNPEVAAPGSFIDASKFTSAKELGEFLKREGSEPKYYNKYFEWHSNYSHLEYPDPMCNACRSLHLNNMPPKIYPSIEQWYNTFARCDKYPSIS